MNSPGRTGIILGAIAAGVAAITVGVMIFRVNQPTIALTEDWTVIEVTDADRWSTN